MKKLFRRLNNLNCIPYVFLAFFAKCIILGTNIPEAISAFAICGIMAWKLHLESKRGPNLTNLFAKDISDLKQALAVVKMNKVINNPDEKTKRFF